MRHAYNLDVLSMQRQWRMQRRVRLIAKALLYGGLPLLAVLL